MSILNSIGNTPITELRKIVPSNSARVLVKLELANPTGSMKDRMAKAVIEGAEQKGELQPGEPHYAILGDCNFSGPIASGATLSDADLDGADLDGADLSGANLNRTNLRLANLPGIAGIVNLAMFGR